MNNKATNINSEFFNGFSSKTTVKSQLHETETNSDRSSKMTITNESGSGSYPSDILTGTNDHHSMILWTVWCRFHAYSMIWKETAFEKKSHRHQDKTK